MVMFFNEDLFKKAGEKTPNEHVAAGTWNWEQFKNQQRRFQPRVFMAQTSSVIGILGYLYFHIPGAMAGTYLIKTKVNLLGVAQKV